MNKKIDQLLNSYKSSIGDQFLPYRNHVQRIALLTKHLKRNSQKEDEGKIAIAAVYHDIGIWTAHTFDYLSPSIEEAQKYLAANDLNTWSGEISLMIDMHHKQSIYKGNYAENVEAFRRADAADLSQGRRNFGLSPSIFKKNLEKYPMLGFRRLVIKKFFLNFLRHPFNSLPMRKK